MRLPSRCRWFDLAGIAFAAVMALVGGDAAAQDSLLTSADGVVVEINRFSPSTRFVGALAVWVQHSYAMSIDCSPPRACYAKSQVVNYHFSCGPRYIVVGERISMDLNGDIVKREVLEPAATSGLNSEIDIAMLERFCGAPPDLSDLLERRREAQERADKPRKAK